jgi:hypothetical protein
MYNASERVKAALQAAKARGAAARGGLNVGVIKAHEEAKATGSD